MENEDTNDESIGCQKVLYLTQTHTNINRSLEEGKTMFSLPLSLIQSSFIHNTLFTWFTEYALLFLLLNTIYKQLYKYLLTHNVFLQCKWCDWYASPFQKKRLTDWWLTCYKCCQFAISFQYVHLIRDKNAILIWLTKIMFLLNELAFSLIVWMMVDRS